jgi:hypothetical protein
MRKLWGLTLAVVVAGGLAACGEKEEPATTAPATTPTTGGGGGGGQADPSPREQVLDGDVWKVDSVRSNASGGS